MHPRFADSLSESAPIDNSTNDVLHNHEYLQTINWMTKWNNADSTFFWLTARLRRRVCFALDSPRIGRVCTSARRNSCDKMALARSFLRLVWRSNVHQLATPAQTRTTYRLASLGWNSSPRNCEFRAYCIIMHKLRLLTFKITCVLSFSILH